MEAEAVQDLILGINGGLGLRGEQKELCHLCRLVVCSIMQRQQFHLRADTVSGKSRVGLLWRHKSGAHIIGRVGTSVGIDQQLGARGAALSRSDVQGGQPLL